MERLDAEDWLGVLHAWQVVCSEGWPSLCSTMGIRSASWRSMSATMLEREVGHYLREMNAPSCVVRVFWKRAPTYSYLGCNDAFARDAGARDASEMVGLDDWSPRIPWKQQGAKYRADDERVVASGKPLLGILERQTQAGEIVYVRTNKAPLLQGGTGRAFGILGMYEILDEATARRLHHSKMRAAGY